MRYLLLSVLVVSLVGLVIPNAFAENVPDWVKNTAGWWADDIISETEFVNAIEFLVKENIIQVDASQTSETSQGVPDWVKNTAGWWADDIISEAEFVNAIAYLIKVGIIGIESSKSPELIAEMWVNGHITDDEFLADVEHMIEKEIITIQSDSITKTSQLPDWLVNNAGWWAARIFTNSDFSDFDTEYVKKQVHACKKAPGVGCRNQPFNSIGIAGDEIKEKPDNTYRIFAVGGSTTYGYNERASETWPGYLQQIINEKITDKEIEVINAGIPGATSASEYEFIKNKLPPFDPDLIIMYDGWNERKGKVGNVNESIRNWESVCKLGKNEGFDTIIIIQPLPITGQRVLTEQEIQNAVPRNLPYLQKSQQYVDAFEELDKVCTKTADFRGIFDYVQEPVFYDWGHTMSLGNKIIAENVFSVISPISFGKTYSVTHSLHTEKNEPGIGVVYAVGSDLSNRNFDNLNLQNAVFDKADLSNTSFKNTNIDGARFVFANLNNSNLLDRTDLSNINLAVTDLSNVNLKGKNLSNTILTRANLTGAILTEADLSGTILIGADLTGAILKDVDLSDMDLSDVNLKDVDLSDMDLSGTTLRKADLRFTDLSGTNLSNSILIQANLSKTDLRTTILDNANLQFANLSESKLLDSLLVNNNFDFVSLKNINFAGKDLSYSSFNQVKFDGSDLQNTILVRASLIQVDLTKIKNKSLEGADLSDASFAHSNLSGVDLTGATLLRGNFWKANLSDLDFTVLRSTSIQGASFIDANMSNSNFEGVRMASLNTYQAVFKDKAYLMRDMPQGGPYQSQINIMKTELFGDAHILLLDVGISGNDLVADYFYYNSFVRSNLENANFKNAELAHAYFYLANLTNADLSGADLRNAFLGNADLSNANLQGVDLSGADLSGADLSGADLSGAVIDANTILKCKNHPICLG